MKKKRKKRDWGMTKQVLINNIKVKVQLPRNMSPKELPSIVKSASFRSSARLTRIARKVIKI